MNLVEYSDNLPVIQTIRLLGFDPSVFEPSNNIDNNTRLFLMWNSFAQHIFSLKKSSSPPPGFSHLDELRDGSEVYIPPEREISYSPIGEEKKIRNILKNGTMNGMQISEFIELFELSSNAINILLKLNQQSNILNSDCDCFKVEIPTEYKEIVSKTNNEIIEKIWKRLKSSIKGLRFSDVVDILSKTFFRNSKNAEKLAVYSTIGLCQKNYI